MKWWVWAVGAGLLGVAAFSVWYAFQSPTFVAGLTTLAAGVAAKAIKEKVVARLPPNEEAAWREAEKAGRGDEWRRKRNGFPPKG